MSKSNVVNIKSKKAMPKPPMVKRKVLTQAINSVIYGGNSANPDVLVEETDEMEEVLSSTSWEDLQVVHDAIAEGLVTLMNAVKEGLQMPGVLKSAPATLTLDIKAFNNDIISFANELRSLKKTYKGKKGPVVDEAEMAMVFETFGQYEDIKNKWFTILLPSYNNIMEVIESHAHVEVDETSDNAVDKEENVEDQNNSTDVSE